MSKRGAASKAVRKYLSANPDATPKETALALRRYKVTPNLVSNIKSRMKRDLVSTELARAEGGGNSKFAAQLLTAAKLLQECDGLSAARAMLELAAKVVKNLE